MKIAQIFEVIKNILPSRRREANNPLKSNSYIGFFARFRDISLKSSSVFPNFLRKHHSGIVLIEAAVTLPVVMYIMLFCLELVKIHLLQISIDKICAECVYHLCSERTVSSFNDIFAKYRPSYVPVGYVRYWCRVYSSLENMASNSPYGGERIGFPDHGVDNAQPTANAITDNFGLGSASIIHKKYGGGAISDIGTTRTSQLQNGVTKGYCFVLTVVARHKFSSAFVEKLFSGGTNTTRAGYYILWSRGSGIVN